MSNTAELDLMDIKQASVWASRYLGKNVTTSNIAYLLQYGRIKKIGTEYRDVPQGDTLLSFSSFKMLGLQGN